MLNNRTMGSFNLTIEQLGPKGDGIHCGVEGNVYVERAMPGDLVKARLHRDAQGIPRAEMLNLIVSSPHRQKAPCPHYDHCGNCTVQHLNEKFYRQWKINLVREAFSKQGLHPRQWLDPIFIGWEQRRRATFTARKHQGKLFFGYYRRRSQLLVDIQTCLVIDPEILSVAGRLKPLLNQMLPEGKTVDLFFQKVGGSMDLLLTGTLGGEGEPNGKAKEALIDLIKGTPVVRLAWRDKEQNEIKVLTTRGPFKAVFGALSVDLPPAAFLQPTLAGEQALVAAMESALPPQGKFADLFSGCGTFTGPLLRRGPVDAYDFVPQSVRALSKAGPKNTLRVMRRDLLKRPLQREELNRYDAIVFDPPRGGCMEQAALMASAKTRTLVGVSCNPATFARDARLLCDGGFWLQSLQVLDQFVWSHHVEVIGVFTRGGSRPHLRPTSRLKKGRRFGSRTIHPRIDG